MKFSDLALYAAVQKVRMELVCDGQNPGSDHWLKGEGAVDLTKRIAVALITKANPDYIKAYESFRKGVQSDDGVKKLDVIIQLAQTNGPVCFYAGRNLGPCSDDVNLERLIPGSKGGPYTRQNCVLACSRHNAARGDQPLEDFLAKGIMP